MSTVCQRCGAEIKNVFRMGDFTFGGECIGKVDAALFERLAMWQWTSRLPMRTAAS